MRSPSLISRIKDLLGQTKGLPGQNEFYASIRPTDTFLITYPKSGTTWMGFMISNVLNRVLDRELNLRNFIELVPDINNLYFNKKPLDDYSSLASPRVLMTHAPYDAALPRVIYVLRDPRDVMVSYWHHKRLTDTTFGLSMREFISSTNHWPCNWDVHVENWLFGNHKNILSVRYEEMQVKPHQVLEEVMDFIGVSHDRKIVERAVHASQFDKMKQLEEKFGVDGAHGSREERFIRRGKVGAWSEELDNDCLHILERNYGRVMRRVGYVPVTLSP